LVFLVVGRPVLYLLALMLFLCVACEVGVGIGWLILVNLALRPMLQEKRICAETASQLRATISVGWG
jgi:hypothetical protein